VAGLPPETGLIALVLPTIAYALLASSRYISVGPTTQVSILVAAGIGGLAAGDSARQAMLATMLALLVGAMLLMAAILRLGFLTEFISRPVFIGYGLGTALTVIASQLAPLIGLKVQGIRFSWVVPQLLARVDDLRLEPALFGLGCIVLYFLFKRWVPLVPSPIVTLAAGSLAVAWLHLTERGIAVVGRLPKGRLALTLPSLSLEDMRALLPSALVISLLILISSNSLGRSLARKHGEALQPNRELLGLGFANVTAAMFAAFPVSSNSSSSRLYEALRCRTDLARVVTAGVAAALLLMAPSFPNMSRAALAAVVMGAVIEGVDWRAPLVVWRFSHREAFFCGVALGGVLLLGLVRGMLLAVVLTLLSLMYSSARPHVAELGAAPDDPEHFADLQNNPGYRRVPGVLVFRVDSALFFANASHVLDEFRAQTTDPDRLLQRVVLDLRSVNFMDFTACEALDQLRKDLAGRGIRLAVANPNGAVRTTLARYGLAGVLAGADQSAGIRQVLQRLEWREQ
jgi:high affinity sulfate transporter 1